MHDWPMKSDASCLYPFVRMPVEGVLAGYERDMSVRDSDFLKKQLRTGQGSRMSCSRIVRGLAIRPDTCKLEERSIHQRKDDLAQHTGYSEKWKHTILPTAQSSARTQNRAQGTLSSIERVRETCCRTAGSIHIDFPLQTTCGICVQ